MTDKPRRLAIEEKLDKLEVLIREKVEVMSGFAAEHAKLRHFVQLLKFYDKNESGYITYSDFYTLMLRFNFVGLTVEIEQLFNRYDVDMNGFVDYRDVAYRLYGIGNAQKLLPAEAMTMERLRKMIAARSINATIRFCHIGKTSSKISADGFTEHAIALHMLTEESENRLPRKSLSQLLDHYDCQGNGKVNVFDFLNDFKVRKLFNCQIR